MTTKHLFHAAIFFAATLSAYADVPVEIYRGELRSDTVYKSTHYIIGITDPAAVATIAGDNCHVYRTGSFGAKVSLNEGENNIPVTVTKDGETTQKNVHLVYIKRDAAPARPAEKTVPLDWPINIVTKKGAYLLYGNGGDRLGGSKMGYIDENIEMTAVGETSRLYKVLLGDNGYAYISKDYVERGGEGARTVNSGSASISNTGKSDRISISLPTRLPYWSRTEIDPSTIKVSLYGATNNTNWLTQRGKTEMVDFVDLQQEQGGVLTMVIRLKDQYQWGYAIRYEGNSLVIDVRHRPQSLALKDLSIGLDAGHGGSNPGAYSPSGLKEKDVNLDIVLKVAEKLREKGAKVVLTRDGDTGPSMTERKRIWLEGGVDLAISVHNNASGNPLVPMGTSSYYKHIANRALASSLHESMLQLGVANFGLTGNFNFSLNAPTEYPNALVEVLFMSSLPEEELLADDDYRAKIADRIVKGIENYLSTVKKSLK